MSEVRSFTTNIEAKVLNKKLDDLENRAVCLDKQFTNLLLRAGQLEDVSNIYAHRIEKERKVASIVQLMMRRDCVSRLLLDYSSMFFEIILRKARMKGVCASSSRELWEDLSTENTSRVFSSITRKLGFSQAEHDVIKLVFEIIHQRDFSVTLKSLTLAEHVMRRGQNDNGKARNSFLYDSDVSSVFLFLQIQDDLHKTVASTFRRMVAVAHCVLMRSDNTKTCEDVLGMGTPEDMCLLDAIEGLEAPQNGVFVESSGAGNGEETNTLDLTSLDPDTAELQQNRDPPCSVNCTSDNDDSDE